MDINFPVEDTYPVLIPIIVIVCFSSVVTMESEVLIIF